MNKKENETIEFVNKCSILENAFNEQFINRVLKEETNNKEIEEIK